MKKILPLLLLLLLCYPAISQEKIKGSRNVTTEKTALDFFDAVVIKGDFEVLLKNDNRSRVLVKAEDNLQPIIRKEVINQTLYITTEKEITRSRSLKLEISYPETIRKIEIGGKSVLETSEDLTADSLEVITRDYSKIYLTVSANRFKFVNGDKAKAELNVTAQDIYFQLNQSSDIKALVKAPVFRTDIYEDASARIEGDTEDFQLRADHTTKFNGENLFCKKASVLAQGRSKNKINVIESLELKAHGRSETDIYNTPEIELEEFSDEAVISKKELKDSSIF